MENTPVEIKTDENHLVSVAMATYNGERYLKEQLDSIYAQTYKNIEVIVTDDCSSDKTVKILEQYAESHGLRYSVNETNLGFVKNFERAISLCKGAYIALADQDDVWEREKIEVLVREIGSDLLIHSDCSIIDGKSAVTAPYWKRERGFNIKVENLLRANVVTGCTVLFKRELLKSALPFPEGIAYHDWWLALCAANLNKIVYIPSCLTRYRQHTGQNTGSDIKNPFKTFFINLYKRRNKLDFDRMIGIRKQRQNLLAIREGNIAVSIEKDYLEDLIAYFDDYLNHALHINSFVIGLRYHKQFYPRNNYLFLKNILYDIVG